MKKISSKKLHLSRVSIASLSKMSGGAEPPGYVFTDDCEGTSGPLSKPGTLVRCIGGQTCGSGAAGQNLQAALLSQGQDQ